MLFDRHLGHGPLKLLILLLAQGVPPSEMVTELGGELELVWAKHATELLGKDPVIERSRFSPFSGRLVLTTSCSQGLMAIICSWWWLHLCTRGVCLDIGVKVLLGSDFLALEEVVGHDVTLVEDI